MILKPSFEEIMTDPDGMILHKALVWTPLIQVVVLCLGVAFSLSIALARGSVNIYLPFISETGAFSPEMCIFSLSLIIGSFLGIIFTSIRFILLAQTSDKIMKTSNYVAAFFGVLAMLGLAGVAAFPMSTVFVAHLAMAGLYFVGSILYFIVSTFITFKKEGHSSTFKLRFLLLLILMPLLFILIICFPIALRTWHENNTTLPALKEPGHKGFGLILFSSILEWCSAVMFCIFNLTFIRDMKNYKFFITAKLMKPEKISGENEVAQGSPPGNSPSIRDNHSVTENGNH